MKKTFLAIALATSVFALSACNSNEEEAVVVSTKYGEISKDDFYKELKASYGNSLIVNLVVEHILESKYEVKEEEVEKSFKEAKEQFGDSFELYLNMQGLTEDQLKENLKFQLLYEKAGKDLVSKKEIEAYYNQAKYELNARHILVNPEDEKLANDIYDRLQKGEDFAKLAKEYSQDPGSSENGGELGWFTVGQMVDAFNNAAYSLEVNEISKPVKSEYGYHIIQVTDKREVENYGTLEEKEPEIRQAILEQKIIELLKDADVKVEDKDLKDAFAKILGTSEDEKDSKDSKDKEKDKK